MADRDQVGETVRKLGCGCGEAVPARKGLAPWVAARPCSGSTAGKGFCRSRKPGLYGAQVQQARFGSSGLKTRLGDDLTPDHCEFFALVVAVGLVSASRGTPEGYQEGQGKG